MGVTLPSDDVKHSNFIFPGVPLDDIVREGIITWSR